MIAGTSLAMEVRRPSDVLAAKPTAKNPAAVSAAVLIAALDSVLTGYSEEERADIRRYLADVLDAYQRFTAAAPGANSARSQQVVDHD